MTDNVTYINKYINQRGDHFEDENYVNFGQEQSLV